MNADEVELSIVIPCLNESETIGICVEKAMRALRENNIVGEVLVADNGSTDGSRELATERGARVVPVPQKGYGHALMGGIAAARGKFVLMGDADDSYDFLEAPRFLEPLRNGADLAQGCRLPSGGGTIKPGAMPFLHYWLGNPVLSFLVRLMFRSPIHDVYCGLRAFRKAWYDTLDMRCTGMEFATEMIIKASVYPSRIAEVTTTLYPDGRVKGRRHLRTFRDGWRTLRFFLVSSPRWLFWYPGLVLIVLGLLGYALAMPATKIMGATLDAHTLLVASLLLLVGHQSLGFGLFARVFAAAEGLLPSNPKVTWFQKWFNLERGLILGSIGMVSGASLLGAALWQWWSADFGPLDYAQTMRYVIPGVTLIALGFQTMLASFFLSILGLRRR